MAVRIKRLTPLNIRALRETLPGQIANGALVLTKTTASWPRHTPNAALDDVNRVIAGLAGTRGHPRHSLHAVSRKLAEATSASRKYGHGVTDSNYEI